MCEKGKYILLTGIPGIGKTTIIKKVCRQLAEKKCKTVGFYTEEVRDSNNERVGFDIITLNGEKATLAKNMKLVKPFEMTRFKVGQYVVFPDNLEKLVLPIFKETNVDVFIIDEIGKMELFSNKFKQEIEKLFINNDVAILATIPVPKAQPIPTVDALRNNPKCQLLSVDKSNRNQMNDVICNMLEAK